MKIALLWHSYQLDLLKWISAVLSTFGLFTTGVLTLGKAVGAVPGCRAGSGCERVLSSPVSEPFGVPLGFLGFIIFGVFFVASSYRILFPRDAQVAIKLVFGLVLACVLTGVGLTMYSVFALHAVCPWCLASNGLFCLLLVITASELALPAPDNSSPPSGRQGIGLGALVATAFAFLSFQAYHLIHERQSMGVDLRTLASVSQSELDPANGIHLGNADGSHKFVAFVDYNCHSCLEMLSGLETKVISDPEFGITLRHFPHEGNTVSYPLARLAQLSANKGQLLQFLHAVLSDSPSSPSEVDQLGKKAGLLAGHEKLVSAPESARLDEAIARDVKVAEQLQITVTPTIIFAGTGARMVVSNLDQGR